MPAAPAPGTSLHEGTGALLLEYVPGEAVGVVAGRFLRWSQHVDLAERLLHRLEQPSVEQQLPPRADLVGGRVNRVPQPYLGRVRLEVSGPRQPSLVRRILPVTGMPVITASSALAVGCAVNVQMSVRASWPVTGCSRQRRRH